MISHSEAEMIAFGEEFAKGLVAPATLELVGDIGVGKTTLVKGIAKGLGITDDVTSPSFTISKTYRKGDITLTHYDFYRLPDPGIMQEDLRESVQDANTITIVEWGSTVKNTLPDHRTQITILYNDDDTRTIEVSP